MLSTETGTLQAWEGSRQAWSREEGIAVANRYAVDTVVSGVLSSVHPSLQHPVRSLKVLAVSHFDDASIRNLTACLY